MKINDINEDSPYAMFKRWAGKAIQPRQYEKAADVLHDVLLRKSKQNRGRLKHGLAYYAQQIARSFEGIDYRALVDFYKDHYGAEGLAESKDYMHGYCHEWALKDVAQNPGRKIYARIGVHYDDDSEEVDHIFTLDPATGKAYDVRGEFPSIDALLSDYEFGADEVIIDEITKQDINDFVADGELKPYSLTELKIEKPDAKDTMGIKRNQMPQVATKDYPEFLDYLKDNGATFTKDTVPADSLKAIQGEFSDQGVEKALRLRKIEKPIIASSDNYIIDGHHRWLAALNTGVDVNIFRVDIPGKQLLQLVKDFPKTTYKDIYTEGPQDFADMNLDGNKLQQSLDYFYKDHAPNKIGGRKEEGSFKGYKVVTFTKSPDTLMFLVDNNDQAVFYVAYSSVKDGVAIGNVRSNGSVRATEVYAHLVDKFGTLYSDDKQTPQGRKIWSDLAKFFSDIDVKDTGDRLVATLAEATDIVNIPAGHILLSDYAKQHISTHNKPGIGSVFSKNINLQKLVDVMQDIPVQGDGGAYTIDLPGAGYHLVLPIEDAKSLPDAQLGTVTKQEREPVKVPAVKTSAPIEQFATNEITVIVRPSNPAYLPDDVKQDEQVLDAIKQGKSYSVITAFPGRELPPASQWNGKYAVIIPNAGKSESIAEAFVEPQFDVEWDEAARYPEFVKIGKEAWIELAKKGTAITIKSAKGIENTDAADPDSFKSLDPNKQKRALAQLEKGEVEMPIVAVYSDGYKELVAGNTRLTAMMARDGKATVWAFKVPDEIALLAEAKEIEFVCVNPAHDNATKQHEQDALFQALKDVPGVIVYRQDFDIHNSMAAILKSNADVKEIKALAKKHNVKIDLTKNVSDRFIDALYTGDLEGVTDWYDSDNLNEAYEINGSLVDKFLKSTGGKYGKRDQCGPACLDFIDWAKKQGIELKRVRGEFVADQVVSAKADFTPEMKKEFAQSGLDWNSAADRKAWIEQSKYAEEWKRVPHYWTVDKDGNIHDPSGYQQLVKTGLAKDLDPSRYIPEGVNETSPFALAKNILDEETTPKMFYHGSYDELPVGTVLTPRGNDYESEWGGTSFYGALEKHRPPEKLAHKEGVFMVGTEEDIDLAGGATDYIYIVKPIGQIQRHDINWGSEISMLVSDGAGLNDPEVKQAADNYWNGVPYEGDNVWEYIAPRAKIVGVLDESVKENFDDGKKPGRKGLAKRSGVDCTKSVTELRKIAKNSSGERARMAHWCANMKAGRKKK